MVGLSVVLLLWVGEAASIRKTDLDTPLRASFYHSKRTWYRAKVSPSAKGKAWRLAIAACPEVQPKNHYVLVAIGADALQLSMQQLLSRSGHHDAGSHAWRRV